MLLTISILAMAFAALAPAATPAAEPEKVAVKLSSGEIDGGGLSLAESDKPVYRIHLTAKLDKKGEGSGTLLLDRTPRKVDEFGLPEAAAALPPVKLECSLKFVKKKKLPPVLPVLPAAFAVPTTPPEAGVECRLFEITGPNITSRLTLAIEGGDWSSARFLVSDKDGKGRIAVSLQRAEQRLPPPSR